MFIRQIVLLSSWDQESPPPPPPPPVPYLAQTQSSLHSLFFQRRHFCHHRPTWQRKRGLNWSQCRRESTGGENGIFIFNIIRKDDTSLGFWGHSEHALSKFLPFETFKNRKGCQTVSLSFFSEQRKNTKSLAYVIPGSVYIEWERYVHSGVMVIQTWMKRKRGRIHLYHLVIPAKFERETRLSFSQIDFVPTFFFQKREIIQQFRLRLEKTARLTQRKRKRKEMAVHNPLVVARIKPPLF